MNIYDEIRAEREAQDAKWGGDQHDDGHTPIHWIRFIADHVARAAGWQVSILDESHWFSASIAGSVGAMPSFRRQMVRVAALAVAAIESDDRRTAEIDRMAARIRASRSP